MPDGRGVDPDEQRSTDGGSALRRLWGSLSTPQRWGGALVLAVIPVLLAFVLPQLFERDDQGAVTTTDTGASERVDQCKNRAEDAGGQADTATAVCRRPFWAETPSLYGVSFERHADPAFSGLSSELDGEVVAVSVEELVQEAVEYAGEPVFVVGRVARNDLIDADETIGREVRLMGQDPTYAVVVTADAILGEAREGEIVADNVFVAARGVGRFTGSSRTVDVAYALGFAPAPVDLDYRESRAIQRQARRLKPR